MTHSKLQTKRLEAQMSQSQLAAAAGINGRMLQYYCLLYTSDAADE